MGVQHTHESLQALNNILNQASRVLYIFKYVKCDFDTTRESAFHFEILDQMVIKQKDLNY